MKVNLIYLPGLFYCFSVVYNSSINMESAFSIVYLLNFAKIFLCKMDVDCAHIMPYLLAGTEGYWLIPTINIIILGIYWRIHMMDPVQSAILFVLMTGISTYLLSFAYKNVKFILKHKWAIVLVIHQLL